MKINFIKCPCGCDLRVMVRSYAGLYGLTDAEAGIADLVVAGLRYKDIARRRGVSERVVKYQSLAVRNKTGMDNQLGLLLKAVAAVSCG